MYNLTKKFKIQIIGIFVERDSLIDQKCTACKCDKKFWQGPRRAALPPLTWTKSKRTAVFFLRRTSLTTVIIIYCRIYIVIVGRILNDSPSLNMQSVD